MPDNQVLLRQFREGNSFFNRVTAGADAFGRARVGFPQTLFDSKLSTASHTLYWDDQEISGSGTASSYSKDRASYILSVDSETAGSRVRQTKQRFNYQPGKSQLAAFTAVMGSGVDGVTRRLGLFDENNGLFFELDGSIFRIVRRSSTTGTPIDTAVNQADFEFYKFDGSEVGLPVLNTAKTLIFVIDFESLQVGTVRFGVYLDGLLIYLHAMDHANILDVAYFSTPNLPVRYEISNSGPGPSATLEAICCTVISEGGSDETGISRYISTDNVIVEADVIGTVYAVIGVKLKAANLDSVVKVAKVSMFCSTLQDNFEWMLLLNPTVAGAFTYGDVTNSAVQSAVGATANTVTGGVRLDGGFSNSSAAVTVPVESLYYLGSTISGVSDEIVLCVRPLSVNADIRGAITIKEIA